MNLPCLQTGQHLPGTVTGSRPTGHIGRAHLTNEQSMPPFGGSTGRHCGQHLPGNVIGSEPSLQMGKAHWINAQSSLTGRFDRQIGQHCPGGVKLVWPSSHTGWIQRTAAHFEGSGAAAVIPSARTTQQVANNVLHMFYLLYNCQHKLRLTV